MNTNDDNDPVKTLFPPKTKPHVVIGGIGKRPNMTLLLAMTAAMSMPIGELIPPPRPKQEDDFEPKP
jgi:hypothetical protein